MPKLYLTDRFTKSAKCPSGQRQILYWDHPVGLDGIVRRGSQAGLGLRVTMHGAATFVHAYHYNGKRRRHKLGSADIMSVTSARLAIAHRLGEIESGIDPDANRIRHSVSTELTVRGLIDLYVAAKFEGFSISHRWSFCRFVAPWHGKARTTTTKRGLNKRRQILAFGQQFTDVPAEQIKPLDIVEYLKTLTSPSAFNQALVHIRALYNWGLKMQVIDVRNPTTPIDKQKIVRRRPEYHTTDIKRIAQAIFNPPTEPPLLPSISQTLDAKRVALMQGRVTSQNRCMREFCAFLGILFLTMARPTELRHAKFEHFDLERMIWHKHNTKGLKLSRSAYEFAFRSVPVHRKVIELVQQQHDLWPEADFLFPSSTDPSEPRDNFARPLKRFKALPGMPAHFQVYDLKRIAISMMIVGQGIRREDVSHYVDHKGDIATTMIYDLGLVDPLRPVADRLGEMLGV